MTTAYVNGSEIRNFGAGALDERILTHLAGEVRVTASGTTTRTDVLHHDQLGSVIGISGVAGAAAEARAYHPFGKIASEQTCDIALTEETGPDKDTLFRRHITTLAATPPCNAGPAGPCSPQRFFAPKTRKVPHA